MEINAVAESTLILSDQLFKNCAKEDNLKCADKSTNSNFLFNQFEKNRFIRNISTSLGQKELF